MKHTNNLKYILVFSILMMAAPQAFSAHGDEMGPSRKKSVRPYNMEQRIKVSVNISGADSNMQMDVSVPNREFPLSIDNLKRHLLTTLLASKNGALEMQQYGARVPREMLSVLRLPENLSVEQIEILEARPNAVITKETAAESVFMANVNIDNN